MRIAVGTDSSTGMSQEEAARRGLFVVPMPFTIDGREYEDGVNLDDEQFYAMMEQDLPISTSQPSPETLCEYWDRALKDHDEVIYIPMTTALSGSFQSAKVLAGDYGGRVHVIDNGRISVTQRQSAFDAQKLAAKGYTVDEICAILEREKENAPIYIMVDTLKYLRRGGRVTAAVAAIGTLLQVRPVLRIDGENLDAYAKVRTFKQAKETMVLAIERDLKNRFNDPEAEHCRLFVAHTKRPEQAVEVAEELRERFPKAIEVFMAPLSLITACHLGPGAVGVAVCPIVSPELSDDTKPDTL